VNRGEFYPDTPELIALALLSRGCSVFAEVCT
jgi:hypothetical protein